METHSGMPAFDTAAVQPVERVMFSLKWDR